MRVGEKLCQLVVRRPHHWALPSLGLEYLDIERLTAMSLDVKTLCVKM
jgi:hypothetical protein